MEKRTGNFLILATIVSFHYQYRNVSFPHEAIRGLDFFSAQVDAFPNITSGRRPQVIWRNASTSAEKKSNPRIASWGKGIL